MRFLKSDRMNSNSSLRNLLLWLPPEERICISAIGLRRQKL